MGEKDESALDSIDPDEFESWLKPDDVWQAYSISSLGARDELQRRLRHGLIRSACATLSSTAGKTNYVLLPCDMWSHLPDIMSSFWKHGGLEGVTNTEIGDLPIALFDIRFEPKAVREMPDIARVAQEIPLPPPIRAKGGRPLKPYWEDAIMAIFDKLYHGDFKPAQQADIETAIAEWITRHHGDEPGESTIRLRAAKIWKIHNK